MAAIQKYRQANVQVGRPTQGGDTGMLASAQAKQSLSQKLQEFSSNLYGMASQMAQTEAAQNAVIDIQTRKQKVAEIRSKGLSTEEEQAEIGKLTEGTYAKFSGVYSQAYNNAAASAYASQIKTDAKSAYDLAMIESGGDPAMFMAMYSKFSQETVRGAPTEASAIVAQETTLNYGTAGYRSLMTAKASAGAKARKTSYKDANDALTKQFSDAYYQNDAIAQARIFAEINAAGEAAVRDGLISQQEHEVNQAYIAQTAMVDTAKRRFNEELNVGRGDLAFQQFIIDERKGMYEGVDPDDIAKMKSSMLSKIKEFNDASLERDRFEIDQFNVMSEQTFNQALQDIAQGRLTYEDITTYEQQGILSLSHANQLRERIAVGATRQVSDAKTLGSYAESHVLIDTEPKMILNDPMLSEHDKTALIKRREDLLATRFNWAKTGDGMEAIRRIRENFGIIEGTLIAKMDMTNSINKDFNDIYKRFYAEASATDPKESVLPIADRLLEEYTQNKADEEAERIKQMKARQIEEAKRLKEIDEDSIFFPWLKSEKPLEYYMLQE